MQRFMIGAIIVLCILSNYTIKAAADPIPGLWNTGVNDNGTIGVLNSKEQHYTVTPSFSADFDLLVGEHANGSWQYPSNPQAEWIYRIDNLGEFSTYSFTFDLNGYDPTTASFSVRWMMDNSGYVRLNGTEIPESRSGYLDWPLDDQDVYYQHLDTNHYGFQIPNLKSFSNSSYFVNGLNQLDFVVLNGGGPAGLYVEFTASDVTRKNDPNPNPVPEPATMLLFSTGLAGLAATHRRKKAC
jgi:hypothetical protein